LKWQGERSKQVELRKKTNKDQEESYHQQVKEQRNGPNPWERVISNCEMNSSQYVGGADVSRMRQAMLARKGDITKGNAKGASFGKQSLI
jgi:Clathrin light chain